MRGILTLEQGTGEIERTEDFGIYKSRLIFEEYTAFFSLRPMSFSTTSTAALYPSEETVFIRPALQVLVEEIVPKEERLRRLVSRYLGYDISKEEFERRFKGIDLEYSHKHMKPEVFKAFVKGLGAISGSSELSHRRDEEIF